MDQIDNYQIVSKLGEGGMGEVYKGVDLMLQREVAIKVLRPEFSNRDDVVQRFRTEAIALGSLHHPNIALVYSFGRIQEQFYMAMEFVNGETLDTLLNKVGALSWQTAVSYTIGVLSGLSHAHQKQIVHRDIKPSNIIVSTDNTLKILDFGIAKVLQRVKLTQLGHRIGTLEYMAPEQIQGLNTDAQSDIYAVGVMLYEMLTGHLPFENKLEDELIQSHLKEQPKSPRSYSNAIPEQLDKLVLKALAKKPTNRYATAHQFSQQLAELLLTEQTSQKPQLTTRSINKLPLITFGHDYPVVILLLLLVLISGFIFFRPIVPHNPGSLIPRTNSSTEIHEQHAISKPLFSSQLAPVKLPAPVTEIPVTPPATQSRAIKSRAPKPNQNATKKTEKLKLKKPHNVKDLGSGKQRENSAGELGIAKNARIYFDQY